MAENITWIESQDHLTDVLTDARVGGNRAVVLVTAPSWCNPCRQFEPHYKRASEHAEGIEFIAIDLDDNPWVTEAYGISGVPKCFVYNDNGAYEKEVKVPMGALPFLSEIKG